MSHWLHFLDTPSVDLGPMFNPKPGRLKSSVSMVSIHFRYLPKIFRPNGSIDGVTICAARALRALRWVPPQAAQSWPSVAADLPVRSRTGRPILGTGHGEAQVFLGYIQRPKSDRVNTLSINIYNLFKGDGSC